MPDARQPFDRSWPQERQFGPAPSSFKPAPPVAPPPIVSARISCAGCGYDLTGTAVGANCPECGTPVATTIRSPTGGEKSSSLATTCFVVGLLSLVVCIPLGPVAILLYVRARRELAVGVYSKSSSTLARVGFILGIIATCILALYAALLIAMAMGII